LRVGDVYGSKVDPTVQMVDRQLVNAVRALALDGLADSDVIQRLALRRRLKVLTCNKYNMTLRSRRSVHKSNCQEG